MIALTLLMLLNSGKSLKEKKSLVLSSNFMLDDRKCAYLFLLFEETDNATFVNRWIWVALFFSPTAHQAH